MISYVTGYTCKKKYYSLI